MFFTVKTSIKILDKVYTPCICYALPEQLKATVNHLVEEGKAEIHNELVFFQNGKKLISLEERENLKREQKKAERKAKKDEAKEEVIEGF